MSIKMNGQKIFIEIILNYAILVSLNEIQQFHHNMDS